MKSFGRYVSVVLCITLSVLVPATKPSNAGLTIHQDHQGGTSADLTASSRTSLSLVAESLVFLVVFGTSLLLFPAWYSLLVGASALFALHQSATEMHQFLMNRSEGTGNMAAMMQSLNVTQPECQVLLICQMAQTAATKFPVLAALLEAVVSADHRGGPFVQGVLGGLSGVDCRDLFGCPFSPLDRMA
ncbi:uncharacterized protein ISCGN_017847 [Ixodes scapularis]